jgi:ribosome biogenesis GTPase / thiamine phosphate phosphatase
MERLDNIGFSHWFRSRLDADKSAAHDIARVVSVHKDRYTITDGQVEAIAEISGNLFYSANSPADLPTTGDWVYADFYDDDTHAIIHGVIPRKTLLRRKTAGKQIDFQSIAANIDVAFIIQSADQNFNLGRLERYLVMVNECEITPVILLSKCDLIPHNEVDNLTAGIASVAPQVTVIACSSLSGENIDAVKNFLLPGTTCCLLGSSGVGKTTLLNSILGSAQFETQAVSKKQGKGKHTTTSRELVRLENGAMLIDTPGMRELGNLSVDTGIDETFAEIVELSRNCKFNNCSHTKETGCAILSAIEVGELSAQRYQNYLKMKNESAFNDLTYFEKRKKEKDFGKMIKSTLKGKSR